MAHKGKVLYQVHFTWGGLLGAEEVWVDAALGPLTQYTAAIEVYCRRMVATVPECERYDFGATSAHAPGGTYTGPLWTHVVSHRLNTAL